MLSILDLIGTFAFAAFGAHVGIRKSFDIFGIAVSAFLSAFGGGTIRDVILGEVPAYFTHTTYITTVVIGILFALAFFTQFERVNRLLLTLDAIGLATFAYLGAHAAYVSGLGAIGIVLLATISAVGGGILRDIAVRDIPIVFYYDLYATPAILLGIFYSLLRPFGVASWQTYILLIGTFLFRIAAIRYGWALWRPYGEKM